ncbi:hypothetical protein G6F31_021237 [Rhizopus arrhizus]|nr:hypothetical protein G6F31_021237 [Rhizopus arrhizus]
MKRFHRTSAAVSTNTTSLGSNSNFAPTARACGDLEFRWNTSGVACSVLRTTKICDASAVSWFGPPAKPSASVNDMRPSRITTVVGRNTSPITNTLLSSRGVTRTMSPDFSMT